MLLKSISYWSFPGGLENTADYGEVFARAKKAGYDAVEAAVGETGVLTPASTEEQCREIAAAARRAGVKIASVATGIYWGCSLSATDPKVRGKAVEYTKKMLRIASWLGTDALLVVPGAVNVFFNPESELVSYDDVWKRAAASIRKCLPTARKVKVAMALENVWNKFHLSPIELRDYIDSFDSEFVRVYLDVGNMLLYGYPEHWIRILGSRIKKVHFKDFRTSVGNGGGFVGLLEGDVNWPEVMKAFGEIGYTGPASVELGPYKYHWEASIYVISLQMDYILGRR